jgi:hypothetical protein
MIRNERRSVGEIQMLRRRRWHKQDAPNNGSKTKRHTDDRGFVMATACRSGAAGAMRCNNRKRNANS